MNTKDGTVRWGLSFTLILLPIVGAGTLGLFGFFIGLSITVFCFLVIERHDTKKYKADYSPKKNKTEKDLDMMSPW